MPLNTTTLRLAIPHKGNRTLVDPTVHSDTNHATAPTHSPAPVVSTMPSAPSPAFPSSQSGAKQKDETVTGNGDQTETKQTDNAQRDNLKKNNSNQKAETSAWAMDVLSQEGKDRDSVVTTRIVPLVTKIMPPQFPQSPPRDTSLSLFPFWQKHRTIQALSRPRPNQQVPQKPQKKTRAKADEARPITQPVDSDHTVSDTQPIPSGNTPPPRVDHNPQPSSSAPETVRSMPAMPDPFFGKVNDQRNSTALDTEYVAMSAVKNFSGPVDENPRIKTAEENTDYFSPVPTSAQERVEPREFASTTNFSLTNPTNGVGTVERYSDVESKEYTVVIPQAMYEALKKQIEKDENTVMISTPANLQDDQGNSSFFGQVTIEKDEETNYFSVPTSAQERVEPREFASTTNFSLTNPTNGVGTVERYSDVESKEYTVVIPQAMYEALKKQIEKDENTVMILQDDQDQSSFSGQVTIEKDEETNYFSVPTSAQERVEPREFASTTNFSLTNPTNGVGTVERYSDVESKEYTVVIPQAMYEALKKQIEKDENTVMISTPANLQDDQGNSSFFGQADNQKKSEETVMSISMPQAVFEELQYSQNQYSQNDNQNTPQNNQPKKSEQNTPSTDDNSRSEDQQGELNRSSTSFTHSSDILLLSDQTLSSSQNTPPGNIQSSTPEEPKEPKDREYYYTCTTF